MTFHKHLFPVGILAVALLAMGPACTPRCPIPNCYVQSMHHHAEIPATKGAMKKYKKLKKRHEKKTRKDPNGGSSPPLWRGSRWYQFQRPSYGEKHRGDTKKRVPDKMKKAQKQQGGKQK